MHARLIACQVLSEPLRALLARGTSIDVLPMSLHTRPAQLRVALQQAIDAVDGHYDPIFLGYGLCSQAVVGLRASSSRLVLPKAHDCISILLGSETARRREARAAAGSYFLSKGWIGAGGGSMFSEEARLAERYGEARAERLMAGIMRHYNRLAYVCMPRETGGDDGRRHAALQARRHGLDYVELPGSTALLEAMLSGPWNAHVIVVDPGESVSLGHFGDWPAASSKEACADVSLTPAGEEARIGNCLEPPCR